MAGLESKPGALCFFKDTDRVRLAGKSHGVQATQVHLQLGVTGILFGLSLKILNKSFDGNLLQVRAHVPGLD